MIYRIYVESKTEINSSSQDLLTELRDLLNIGDLSGLRILKRYDVEGIPENLLESAIRNVFSQPALDDHFFDLELAKDETAFAVGYLPGQFDQRADSAAVCIQMLAQVEKPRVKYATVYVLKGQLTEAAISKIKNYLINPVDSEEVSLELPTSLALNTGQAASEVSYSGFNQLDEAGLKDFLLDHDLAMDLADLSLVQKYFQGQSREPSHTEIKVIDTYWSDHCRHTTFNTVLDQVVIEDDRVADTYADYLKIREKVCPNKPISLMNMATIVMRKLRAEGKLSQVDISDEINACTIKVKVQLPDKEEDWLLLFKNETHNHPTEIEPFGGAATCIGGAIRDPLSGRAYVYAAMRLSGCGNPLEPIEKTLPGKLPQRKIAQGAAHGYSSYGNQIGLATSIVDEFYHPSYVAKHLECGAVLGAVKADQVIREKPQAGDLILLVGGRTGRDGIGGATGSSKSHQVESVELCGAQVQKGNALEERKLQRLFRRPEVSRSIKKCNDFGAGGVSVAVGELADGLEINLDAIPKKYAGLSATDLAISESQERMALVIDPEDLKLLEAACAEENVEATVVAKVTQEPVLKMIYQGQDVVCIDRSFLDTNGAVKSGKVKVTKVRETVTRTHEGLEGGLRELFSDLNHCSKAGLSQQFDSSIGSGSIFMPFGGKYQTSPIQAMVNRLPVLGQESSTCSVMAYGFNPGLAEADPYLAAYVAVVDSVCKLVAAGGDPDQVHLSLQEYFPSLGSNPEKWGLPFAALMGAIRAQLDLEVAAIGGKDSMSGTFEDLDVIPTLISFAVSLTESQRAISPEFKKTDNYIYLLETDRVDKAYLKQVEELLRTGQIKAAYSLSSSSPAEAVFRMGLGNRIGAEITADLDLEGMFAPSVGGFIFESQKDLRAYPGLKLICLGKTCQSYQLTYQGDRVDLAELEKLYQSRLTNIYPTHTKTDQTEVPTYENWGERVSFSRPSLKTPKVLIPIFPGSNCEFDSARAFERAGAEVDFCLVKNLTVAGIGRSIEDFCQKLEKSQVLFLPGGFSGADEPDGSAKFITSFLRNQQSADAITGLLKEEGLILGICNGFQALIKLGLLPYGKILEADAEMPTLATNKIKLHQSRIVNIRVASNASPWLSRTKPGQVFQVPISHGEGRLVGQVPAKHVAFQYCDDQGKASCDIKYCPNHSQDAIEGLISADGRILGKMGHSERLGLDCYKNVPGNYDMGIFKAAVDYFRKV